MESDEASENLTQSSCSLTGRNLAGIGTNHAKSLRIFHICQLVMSELRGMQGRECNSYTYSTLMYSRTYH